MLRTLGRGLAPAATAATLLLFADGLLTESGRPLATQTGDPLRLDIVPPSLSLASELDAPLSSEAGDDLTMETSAAGFPA